MPRSVTPANDGKVGKITLRKEDLERDGFVDDDGEVQPANYVLNRRGPGRYEVVMLEDGQVLDSDPKQLASAEPSD